MTDPYSRLDYRRMIAWPDRIQREWPLLRTTLSGGSSNRLLDLGCGTGEHARFLVSKGFEVVAIDRSPTNLRSFREQPLPPGLEVVEGDLQNLERLVSGQFGGAICLGNTLPHLLTEQELTKFLTGARRVLTPGAPLLIQLLNYDRIFRRNQRSLPVNFRRDEDGEIVFLRLMDLREDGTVGFFPSTLLFRPDLDPPLIVKASKRVELMGWRSARLLAALEDVGFERIEQLGAFDGSPFQPEGSTDLIVLAR